MGGGLEAGLSLIAAEGTAADGSRGQRMVTLPTLAMVLDARVRLAGYLSLRLAPNLEFLLLDRSFGVDGEKIVDDGVLRGGATLSLLVDFPLHGAEGVQP